MKLHVTKAKSTLDGFRGLWDKVSYYKDWQELIENRLEYPTMLTILQIEILFLVAMTITSENKAHKLTYKEIGQILGKSYSVIYSNFRRSLCDIKRLNSSNPENMFYFDLVKQAENRLTKRAQY